MSLKSKLGTALKVAVPVISAISIAANIWFYLGLRHGPSSLTVDTFRQSYNVRLHGDTGVQYYSTNSIDVKLRDVTIDGTPVKGPFLETAVKSVKLFTTS